MLSARDYVEIMTCRRLNRRRATDLEVDDQEFNECVKRLDNLIHKMSFIEINKVPGFDPEDLQGFFVMKIHQQMRRGAKYNNEFSYFARAFQNVVRNLVTERKTALKKLYKDPLEDSLFMDL